METKDTLSSCSNSEEQQMEQIQDKAKRSCMVSFRLLHSYLKVLSNNNFKGTRTECGFKREFVTLFRQDVTIFTVTTHYLPKERESTVVKPHHVIASSESRNSSKNMSRFSSNDIVHNHYLEEAKKKTQERGRNSRPGVMPPAKSQSTTNDYKPKPRIDNQKSRTWLASKTIYIMTKTVPIAKHSRNS
uniref:Uncharacterized protein n=1 Tax=Tanacetum cinerariifolium TaxID=118510 RepID=A0A6L2JM91_TANCI|nr:hypothetical protein [Tanacetum cinerariifolium]